MRHINGVYSQRYMQVKRAQVNDPRNLAVYLARKMSGLSPEDIGQESAVITYSSVSRIVTRDESSFLKVDNYDIRLN